MPTDYIYKCPESKTLCEPYTVTFSPGIYKIELWGAQGGNLTNRNEGGRGGYAAGYLHSTSKMSMYLYIGAGGLEATSGFTKAAFNGGGAGNCNINNYYNEAASGGGGGTDLRTSHSLYSRILVAGAGSGATYIDFDDKVSFKGACGGGYHGADGNASIYLGEDYEAGKGGEQEIGGTSVWQNGIFGYGGNQTTVYYGSGGGGGWFGGGCGRSHGATGGGGSGFASGMLTKTELISGCSLMPSFYSPGEMTAGHTGEGAARITFIASFQRTNSCHIIAKFYIYLFIIFA